MWFCPSIQLNRQQHTHYSVSTLIAAYWIMSIFVSSKLRWCYYYVSYNLNATSCCTPLHSTMQPQNPMWNYNNEIIHRYLPIFSEVHLWSETTDELNSWTITWTAPGENAKFTNTPLYDDIITRWRSSHCWAFVREILRAIVVCDKGPVIWKFWVPLLLSCTRSWR